MSAKARKSGLGKGLSALLSDSNEENVGKKNLSSSGATLEGTIAEIPVNSIEVNPFQPRTDFNEDSLKELAESISVQGIIQPITVRKLNEKSYQLISGERRFQASKRAGLKMIPAYIRVANDQQMLEMALIENIQRENLNAIEIALSYQRLLDECELKQEELGDRVGKNRTTVNNYLRLLKLPPDIQVALRDSVISMGHARALITVEDVGLQLGIFKKIVAEGLSVRKVEEYVRSMSKPKSTNSGNLHTLNEDLARLQDQLSTHFGTKIKIKSGKNEKGEISIPFASTGDLNRILEILEV